MLKYKNENTLINIDNEVHVWRARVDQNIKDFHSFWCILNYEEQKRAKEFYFQNDRNRYVVARGVLRKIISLYSGIIPEEIIFEYNKYGKPYISSKNNFCLIANNLKFNLSYSNNAIVYGFAMNIDIGIDIEYNNENLLITDIDSMARNICTEKELCFLSSLPSAAKINYFYKLWTAKESITKLMGKGLLMNLKMIDISFDENKLTSVFDIINNCKYNLTSIPFYSYLGYYSSLATTLSEKLNKMVFFEYK